MLTLCFSSSRHQSLFQDLCTVHPAGAHSLCQVYQLLFLISLVLTGSKTSIQSRLCVLDQGFASKYLRKEGGYMAFILIPHCIGNTYYKD
jgi:hypothetical protein